MQAGRPRDVIFRWGGVVAAALYLLVLWKVGDKVHEGISLLFVLAIGSLEPLSLRTDASVSRASSTDRMLRLVGGLMCLLFVGLLSWVSVTADPERDLLTDRRVFSGARLAPLLAVSGLALLQGGSHAWRWYRREGILALFWSVPTVVASLWFDVSPLTARAAEWNLRVMGYEVVRDGLVVALQNGSVRVYPGCSGIEAMGYLLGLSAVCLIAFPTKTRHWYWLPWLSIVIAFWINSLRVSWLVMLADRRDRPAFDYWHVGQGSLLFGMLAVAVLGLIYVGLLVIDRRPAQKTQL